MSALLVLTLRDAVPLERTEGTLRDLGHDVLGSREVEPGLELARRERPAVVVLGSDFSDLPARVAAHLAQPGCPSVLVLVGPGEASEWLPLAADPRVRLGRLGASPGELGPLIEALRRARSRALAPRESPLSTSGALFSGSSAGARRLGEKVARLAATPDSTLLVEGPRGAGLGAAVQRLHDLSPRAAGALVPLPASFSGRAPEEVLERAAGGTLLVPGVEDLGPEGQEALVALLENRSWQPREGRLDRPLDARIVATSHGRLEERVESGRFREDLFYRLNVLTLRLPDLEERREDLPDLVEAILAELRVALALPRLRLGPGALEALSGRPWPGQLEELRLALTHGALTAEGALIGPGTLEPAGGADDPFHGKRALREVEEDLILRVLEEQGNNRSRAARVLGVNRATLYNKLRTYGHDDPG